MKCIRVLFFSALVSMLPGILSAEIHELSLKVFPDDYILSIDGEQISPRGRREFLDLYYLEEGNYNLTLSCPGYVSRDLSIDLSSNTHIEEKLERSETGMDLIAYLPSGGQPKSVTFTPDGRHLVAATLNDDGFDLYTVHPPELQTSFRFTEAPYSERKGFVESAYLVPGNELWISQMPTGTVHIFDSNSFTFKERFQTGGRVPKVIVFSLDGKRAFVSNWESRSISVIDTESRKVLKIIKMSGIPRGMAISPDGNYLYAGLYHGVLGRINLKTLEFDKEFRPEHHKGSSLRHVVVDAEGNRLFISDLRSGFIHVFNLTDETWSASVNVGPKLNTIAYHAESRLLYISSRGHNAADTYLRKGPDFGRVYVLDTETLSVIDWAWGGNQPTGLDISPDGLTLAFSDFLDHRIELYDVSGLALPRIYRIAVEKERKLWHSSF